MAKVSDLKTPKNPSLDDVASWERSTYSLSGNYGPRYNPDQLVGRKGLEIYAKMRADDQVKAVMQFKRDAITARGWSFCYDDGSSLPDAERKKRVRVFSQLFQRIQGGFEDALNIVMTGRDYGFSMTEKVVTQIEVDKTPYIGLRFLLGRDPCSFQFYTDEYGLLVRTEQNVGGKKQDIDMSRFVHYVHAPEFDRYYGRSDLREAYRPWYIKERIGDFWVLFLERFAGGFLVASRTQDSSMTKDSPEYATLQNVIQNLHGASGIIPPKGVEIELMFPSTTDAFEKAMVFWDLAIARSMLVPNLLGLSHTGQTGAFAQSQTQMRAFLWTVLSDARRVQATIDEQVVKPLCMLNFGDDQHPSFKFNEMDLEFVQWLVETLGTLNGKAIVLTEADEVYIRKLVGLPERKPEDKPLVDPVTAGQEERAGQGQEFEQGMAERKQDHTEQQAEIANQRAQEEARLIRIEDALDTVISRLERSRDPIRVRDPNEEREPTDHSEHAHDHPRTCTPEVFTRAVQRVYFTVIEDEQEKQAAQLARETATQVARSVKRLLGTDEQMAELLDDNLEDVASVELSSAEKGRLQGTYRRALNQSFAFGSKLARGEINRAKSFENVSGRATFASLRDKAAQFFEVNSYRMAGNVSDATRAVIQAELQNSIKLGRSPMQAREAIWNRLVEQGLTAREIVRGVETDEAVIGALNELWVDTEEDAAHYLDTLARTNLFEAMNEARFAEFTDPALDGFVVALEYSSILDDRTTEICRELDNSVYASTSDLWNEYRPPNHFNCRSVLVPITEIDGWDGQESPTPRVDPQTGFGDGTK